jgi:hypothetical protein
LGVLYAMRGDFEAARTTVGTASAIFQELGLAVAAVDTCGRAAAEIELIAGSPHEAERALRQACTVLQDINQTQVLATRAGELAKALFEQGRDEEAEIWTRLAHDSAGTDDIDAALTWQPVQARILARRGALEQAEQLARDTVELAARTDALNQKANASLALAEVLHVAQREEEAVSFMRGALDIYELKGNRVSADRVRALIPEAAVAD